MKDFVGLRAKSYSYLESNNNENKKVKDTNKCVKFQDYKSCLEAAQFENKINHLVKKKIDVDSLKGDQKEIIENNKLILKTQQRFKSERHNVFAEETSEIALSSNGDKRMQSIDSIETYAYGTSKEIICNNITKQYKKDQP